ncbi:hypothetical protein [Serratia sp. C2(2)]|uniref:hypothetical protein n=1 Tax=Serratia sp. C2(2) TaxID=3117678 RepID=UPI002ED40476|nr:hypothetical protein [Serratia sp. C2(1)]
MFRTQYCIFIMWGCLLRYAPLVIASFVILVLLWNTSFGVIKRRFFRFAVTFTRKYEQSGGRSGFSTAAGIIMNRTSLYSHRLTSGDQDIKDDQTASAS